MSNIKRIVFITLGIITLLIGIVGCVLPIIPGGVFLIISTICFMRVSKRFSNWVRSSKIYKKYFKKHLDRFVNDELSEKRKEKIKRRINIKTDKKKVC